MKVRYRQLSLWSVIKIGVLVNGCSWLPVGVLIGLNEAFGVPALGFTAEGNGTWTSLIMGLVMG